MPVSFTSFQTLTMFMIFPSTVLTGFLIYVILKKSPVVMQNYKYMMIYVAISVWQFDFVDSVLLCPTVIEYVKGMRFYGLLGQWFPLEGHLFVTVFIVSISIIGVSLVLSFVWREYALIKFEFTPFQVTVQALHILSTVSIYAGLFPILRMTFPIREVEVEEMKLVKDSDFDPLINAFIIIPGKNTTVYMDAWFRFGWYTSIVLIAFCSFSTKSTIMILWEIRKPRQYMSTTTIRLHKTLLYSLLVQTVTPLLLFVLPYIILILSIFISNVHFNNGQIAAIMVAIPSLYSTFHVVTVVYFTKPYLEFLKRLLTGGNSIHITSLGYKRQHLESVSKNHIMNDS